MVNSISYDAISDIREIHDLYYWNNPNIIADYNYSKDEFKFIFLFCTIIINLSIVLFLLKYIYFKDFLLSFFAVIFFLSFLSTIFTLFDLLEIFYIFSIFINILLFYQLITFDKVKKSSWLKTIIIIYFPIMIVIMAFVIVNNYNLDNWWLIAGFAYLPFVPLLKRALLKLLSVPKE